MCRRRIRTQSEWKVEISGCLGNFFPRSTADRSFISSAALLVKVTARMRSGAMRWRISSAMRKVTTRVLPVPAPARTSSGPESVLTASFCGGLRSMAWIVRQDCFGERGSGCTARSVGLFRPGWMVAAGFGSVKGGAKPVLTPLAWRRYTYKSIMEPTRTPVKLLPYGKVFPGDGPGAILWITSERL